MTERTTMERRHLRLVNDPLPLPRDRWYPIMRAREVERRPVTVQRLGRRIVLWRDAEGRLAAHDARCPHRGADLGLGRVVAGQLECPYHGFRFAADGRCTAVPCEPEGARIRRDLALARHEVREHRGLVWLWHGAGMGQDAELPWFHTLPDSDRHAWDYATVWPLPQLRVMEGMLDLHHAPFAHRRWLRRIGTRLDPYEVTVTEDTVHTQGTLRRPDQPPERGFTAGMDARLPGLLHIRFGSRMHGLVAVTPIDRDHTWIYARYFVELPVLGKLAAALGVWAEFALVQPDDQRMLRSTSPREPDVRAYKLVRADLGIAQWHRLFARACGEPAEAAPRQAALPRASNDAHRA
jgi:phenylpropionate dioxygenase-like ring-hydroxylating dioxygenase large terminal subunit